MRDGVLTQVEDLEYLGVLFMNEGKMGWDINRWIGVASAVIQTLDRSVIMRRELS